MSNLLIQDVPLMVLPTLATKIGLNEAMFLQQLHYWVERSKHEMDGHRWVYNTVDDWVKQFPFWSRRTLARIISNLEKQLLIIAANYNRKGLDRTKWYTVNYERIAELEKERTSFDAGPNTGGEDAVGAVRGGSVASDEPNIEEKNTDPSTPSESESLDGTSIMPNWHNGENQGRNLFAPKENVSGTSIVPNWHNGNLDGIGDNSGTMSVPDCPNASGQNGTMECAILAQPIPENNNREYKQRTTTTTSSNSSSREESFDQGPLELLLSSASDYGLQENMIRASIREFGEELVLKEFELLKKLVEQKKPIRNPAGWFRCALKQEYVDTGADYEKIQQKKKEAANAKNLARQRFYEQLAAEEREKHNTVIDPSSPLYEILQRHVRKTNDAVT